MSEPAIDPEVLPAPQAAKLIGLATATLSTLRSRGGGPPYLKIGRRVIYRVSDLREWRDSKSVTSTADNKSEVLFDESKRVRKTTPRQPVKKFGINWEEVQAGRSTHQQTCYAIERLGIVISTLEAIDKTVYSLTIGDLDERMSNLKDVRDV